MFRVRGIVSKFIINLSPKINVVLVNLSKSALRAYEAFYLVIIVCHSSRFGFFCSGMDNIQ